MKKHLSSCGATSSLYCAGPIVYLCVTVSKQGIDAERQHGCSAKSLVKNRLEIKAEIITVGTISTPRTPIRTNEPSLGVYVGNNIVPSSHNSLVIFFPCGCLLCMSMWAAFLLCSSGTSLVLHAPVITSSPSAKISLPVTLIVGF